MAFPTELYISVFDAYLCRPTLLRRRGPVALDMGSMGKGQIWVNGHNVGHNWLYRASSNFSYTDLQRERVPYRLRRHFPAYQVPRSWLKLSRNLIVVLGRVQRQDENNMRKEGDQCKFLNSLQGSREEDMSILRHTFISFVIFVRDLVL
jgi:hypothetical protein